MHIHRHGRSAFVLATVLTLASALPPARAGDWPQLWGPSVTGAVEAVVPVATSLRELWRRPIGSGFSGITVAGERGYTGESDGTSDHAIAFDARTGRTLWRAALGETYRGHDGSRDGPIATPALGGGRVFMAGPRGVLVALDAVSGRELWRKDLLSELKAKAPFYGFGASPIVASDRVVLQVGGTEKSGLVALDAASGALAWSALVSETRGDSAGYTMAAPATIGGEDQLVATAHDRVFAVRSSDGALAWSHALGEAEEPTRAPLVLPEDRVLVSRGTASILLKLTHEGGAWKAAESWRSPRLKGGLSPTVHEAGSLFGFGGQYLLCVDAATGEPRWREKTNSGALIRVGRQLVVLGEQSGLLRVAAAEAAGSGKLAWHVDMKAQFVSKARLGCVSSPLLDGERVIVQTGAPEQKRVVALDRRTGAVAWTADGVARANYGSPGVRGAGAAREILIHHTDVSQGDPRGGVTALRADDGQLVWHNTLDRSWSWATPVAIGEDKVLVLTWNDAVLVQVPVAAKPAVVLWRSAAFTAYVATPVFHDGHLYGHGGDFLRCVRASDGKAAWEERTYPGSVVLVDGHLVALSITAGLLRVVEANPQAYRERARLQVLEPGARAETPPSVVGRRVFVRNDEEVVAVDVEG